MRRWREWKRHNWHGTIEESLRWLIQRWWLCSHAATCAQAPVFVEVCSSKISAVCNSPFCLFYGDICCLHFPSCLCSAKISVACYFPIIIQVLRVFLLRAESQLSVILWRHLLCAISQLSISWGDASARIFPNVHVLRRFLIRTVPQLSTFNGDMFACSFWTIAFCGDIFRM